MRAKLFFIFLLLTTYSAGADYYCEAYCGGLYQNTKRSDGFYLSGLYIGDYNVLHLGEIIPPNKEKFWGLIIPDHLNDSRYVKIPVYGEFSTKLSAFQKMQAMCNDIGINEKDNEENHYILHHGFIGHHKKLYGYKNHISEGELDGATPRKSCSDN